MRRILAQPELQLVGLLSATFVELTDTMVAGFDVIDFLHVLTDRTVQLLDVSAPGCCWLTRAVSCAWRPPPAKLPGCWSCSSCRTTRHPCLDCFRAGPSPPRTWPPLEPLAAVRAHRRQAGFAAVQALPMRLREQVIGALNLFRAAPGSFPAADICVGHHRISHPGPVHGRHGDAPHPGRTRSDQRERPKVPSGHGDRQHPLRASSSPVP